MNPKTKLVRKKRRSVVRILASSIPNFLWEFLMPTIPRMHFISSAYDKVSMLKINNLDESNSSFCAFKSYIHNRKPPEVFNSTPKKDELHENLTFRALQDELDEIKKQIAKLMERQNEQLQCSDYGTLISASEQLQRSSIPPPPPPPPPLPKVPLITDSSSLKVEKKKKLPVTCNGFLYGKELLKELKKVQLKKVEKSPGGGPLKKSKNDPGDFLEEALKKRFGSVRNSPNSSRESTSLNQNESFGYEAHSSYELEKGVKIAVA